MTTAIIAAVVLTAPPTMVESRLAAIESIGLKNIGAEDDCPHAYTYTEADCVEAPYGRCEHEGYLPDSWQWRPLTVTKWRCKEIRGLLYVCNWDWPQKTFVHLEDYTEYFHERRMDFYRMGIVPCDGIERSCRTQDGLGAPLTL
jgi:hypothetical protein